MTTITISKEVHFHHKLEPGDLSDAIKADGELKDELMDALTDDDVKKLYANRFKVNHFAAFEDDRERFIDLFYKWLRENEEIELRDKLTELHPTDPKIPAGLEDVDPTALDDARAELACGHAGEALHILAGALGPEFIDLEDRVRAAARDGKL